jgi:hypothetical protein
MGLLLTSHNPGTRQVAGHSYLWINPERSALLVHLAGSRRREESDKAVYALDRDDVDFYYVHNPVIADL